jgi:hypothetical protein
MTYAKEVAETTPDDIMQGRPGEKGIPHSDQWLERPKPQDGKMWKKNRKSVMIDRNGRAVPTSLAEEMYQARECRDSTLRAMHEGLYDSGKYFFKFPPAWNQLTLNKRVAVRRIDTPANDYLFNLKVGLQFGGAESGQVATQEFSVSIPSSYSIQEALGAIMALSRKTGWDNPLANDSVLLATYEQNFTVTFRVQDPAKPDLYLECEDSGFWEMLNIEPNFVPPLTNPAQTHQFRNVWDRKTLFLHASFVSDTTAGYLGRGGEFYSKPSKLYRHGNWNDFFIETSLDGYHKVPLPYENWIVELSLILDADAYQSA